MLKDLEKVVRKILTEEPRTRGDDDLLYIKVLEQRKIKLTDYDAKSFILNYRKLGIPTIETVGRCRRKVQEQNEFLKPTPEIVLKRKKLEHSFYNYSLGYKEG